MADASLGPLILGVEGVELTPADRERLSHPLVGGVILFARNFADARQLHALTSDIRSFRDPPLLVSVDHEGGRVQRFREGFTAIPAMRSLGEAWDRDVASAAREAARLGWTFGRELREAGVDYSYAPVLDLDYGTSGVIGDRAFHRNPNAVAHLGACLCRGLRAAGCAAVGKHFPGHGFVVADSHVDVPVDERPLSALIADDLVPFGALVRCGIEGIMPAHVIYPDVDAHPAGFSRLWVGEFLRRQLGFDGIVFSDDLCMAGACVAGDVVARAESAIAAGCDTVLACNEFDAMDALLSRWRPPPQPDLARRLERMRGRTPGPCP